MQSRIYIAIDLKSFYASVECVYRGLDPLTADLVVADPERTEKTICLAVSPALKSAGIPGRPRLFEVVQKVEAVNALRRQKAPGGTFTGSSWDSCLLAEDPGLSLDYIVAPPRMAAYMQTSAAIYRIYLQYFAPEDIHVYSIDEVFIDITGYLQMYGLSPEALARKVIEQVLEETGITATVGIGTNLYLSKVAMDIVAKKLPADRNGVRIASLDEMSYRRELWSHRPLTDFWRVGHGYQSKLEKVGLHTMGDIARCSLGKASDFHNPALLYKLFGVNAELLIDHAWGWEPCTMEQVKRYRPQSNSLSTGQVLHCPYTAEKALLVVREMTDLLALDLTRKGLVTDQLTLTVGYDVSNLADEARQNSLRIQIVTDHYGRKIPRHSHGTVNLGMFSASSRQIVEAVTGLYQQITNPDLLVRRLIIAAHHIYPAEKIKQNVQPEQLDLFTQSAVAERPDRSREQNRQRTILQIKEKYGKNAILKGMNLTEDATTRDRNAQIGGHKA
ncbi:MAG: DNA methylase [Oscillospiraceae bacterium]|nr:DNA methylase [Oscillospiraceae bacterium]